MNCFFYDESIGRNGPNEVILLLNYVLETLIERYRTFHHLILWADNSPAQFKHCILFFLLGHPCLEWKVSSSRSEISVGKAFLLNM